MMKGHLFINAWCGQVQEQLAELYHAAQQLAGICSEQTIIIWGGDTGVVTGQWPAARVSFWRSEYADPRSVLDRLAREVGPDSCVLFGSDPVSMELAVRLAVRRQGTSLVHVEELEQEGTELVAYKRICSGNLLGKYTMQKAPYCLSMAKCSSGPDPAPGGTPRVDVVQLETGERHVELLREVREETERKLDRAKRILLIGNGVKKKEDVEKLCQLAREIHAEVGGSRPVVMKGLLPLQDLVGVSGTIVGPDVCIAVGVSGTAALYEGIERSGCIIAVNTDPDAPIMAKADFTVHRGWQEIL